MAQMHKRFGNVAVVYKSPKKSEVILPWDATDAMKQHEYVHTQREGLLFGLNGGILRGFEEAAVEFLTEDPQYYLKQRIVVDRIMESVPGADELVIQAGDDLQARRELYHVLIREYGLQGFLAICRMSPFTSEESKGFYYAVDHAVFVPPESVNTFLSRKNSKYADADQQTLGFYRRTLLLPRQEVILAA